MYTHLYISHDQNRAIMLQSPHPRKKPRDHSDTETKIPRSEAGVSSKAYRDALQRAFNIAKRRIFFNPDMTNFITLTYKGADHDYEKVLQDVKNLINTEIRKDRAKRGAIKYIYVMEYQKRGSIHVHMIANDLFSLHVNKNGYKELAYWQKGFSSVLTIRDFDTNFRPYLYLFKYMRKSQRIGKSFIHSSRNLDNYTETDNYNSSQWKQLTQEHTTAKLDSGVTLNFYRSFLQKHDIIDSHNIIKGE